MIIIFQDVDDDVDDDDDVDADEDDHQEFSPLSPAPLTSSRSMDWGPGFEEQHDNITISRFLI